MSKKLAILKQLILEEYPELLPLLEEQETQDMLKALSDNERTKNLSVEDIIKVVKETKKDIAISSEVIELIAAEATPIKGTDYFTEEDIAEFLEIASPVKGVDYSDGEKGEPGDPGRDGSHGRDGRDGRDGTDGKDGKDLDQDPGTLARKLNSLKEALNPEVIKGLSKLFENFAKEFKRGGKHQLGLNDVAGAPLDMRWHGGGLTSVIHDDTLSGDGTSDSPLTVVGGGGGSTWSFDFLPPESTNGNLPGDGSVTVFTIPSDTVQVIPYADGVRALPDNYSVVSGGGATTITFNSGKQPFSSISIDYNV